MSHSADQPSSKSFVLNRRVLLQGASALAVAAATDPKLLGRKARASDAATLVTGKDSRLIVHTAKPAVLETPAELLAADQVTPTPLLFVRNNQQPENAATTSPADLAGWRIELAGLVGESKTIDAELLTKLPQVDVEMVVQCSGNSRTLFAQAAKTKGTQWGRGGMGNVRFGGVRLSALMDHLKVKPRSDAKFLSAEGADAPAAGEQDFEHSVPLDEALKKGVLALRLNGEPLPAIHGGPVRLVMPGYCGTMHVKWLNRLRFDTHESTHISQIPNYRTPLAPIKPGQPMEMTFENSEPNWRMKIKSVVLLPVAGSQLPIGKVEVQGVAFNDGEARIESVLVSTDRGKSWQRAELNVPESPYAWYRWRMPLELAAGEHQIWATAVDTLGRTQPLDGAIHWNPQGYLWNGVEKIDVRVV